MSAYLTSLFLFVSSSPSVDTVRQSLEADSARWFGWLVKSSIIVGIGVALEAPEATILLKRWYLLWRGKDVDPPNETSLVIPIAYLGLVLVVGGVVGEGIFEFLSAQSETALRSHDETILADTESKFGQVKDFAEASAKAAGKAGEETGTIGRKTELKTRIIVAAEEDGNGIGRIRLRTIPNTSKASLHGFIRHSIAPGSVVRTDGWHAYMGLNGYVHDRQVQMHRPKEEHLLPRAHRVISLLKRWLLGTHQGAISPEHLDDYLDEFTFRFNRRTSKSRGKLFYRLAQQAVQTEPAPFATLVKPQQVV